MPISKDQFNQGFDDTENAIVRLLKEHPAEALTATEIDRALGNTSVTQVAGRNPDLAAALIEGLRIYGLMSTLDGLTNRRKIDKKRIKGETFYTAIS